MPTMMTPRQGMIAGLVITTCALTACSSPTSPGASTGSSPSASTTTTGLPTAHYANGAGDTASVTLFSQPLVEPGQVANPIAQACLANDNTANAELLNRALFREVDLALTLTSRRPAEAGIQFGRSSFRNSPFEQTFVQVTSDGAALCSGAPFTGTTVSPGQTVHFTIWLIYPNVLSPSQPSGDQTEIDAAAWSTPTVFLAGAQATIRSVTGAGLTDALFFPAGQVVHTTGR
jgi:hypothetical protein